MNAYKETLIYCDGEGCELDEAFSDDRMPNAKRQRTHFKVNGWHHIRAKDYCPDCFAKRQAAKEKIGGGTI